MLSDEWLRENSESSPNLEIRSLCRLVLEMRGALAQLRDWSGDLARGVESDASADVPFLIARLEAARNRAGQYLPETEVGA